MSVASCCFFHRRSAPASVQPYQTKEQRKTDLQLEQNVIASGISVSTHERQSTDDIAVHRYNAAHLRKFFMKPRHDHKTAKLINLSVDILESNGMYLATRMLCECGVRFETALRVLSQSNQRRTCVTAPIR
jgi:hypothetical protein